MPLKKFVNLVDGFVWTSARPWFGHIADGNIHICAATRVWRLRIALGAVFRVSPLKKVVNLVDEFSWTAARPHAPGATLQAPSSPAILHEFRRSETWPGVAAAQHSFCA